MNTIAATAARPMPTFDSKHRPHVLVADDQPDVLEALRLLLKTHGYDTDTAGSPAAVLSALEKRDYDALLLDMNYTRDTTSGREGLDLLQQLGGLEQIGRASCREEGWG